MKKQKTHAASASHEEWVVDALRSDPEFAVEYFKQAMAGMDDPDGRAPPDRGIVWRHCKGGGSCWHPARKPLPDASSAIFLN